MGFSKALHVGKSLPQQKWWELHLCVFCQVSFTLLRAVSNHAEGSYLNESNEWNSELPGEHEQTNTQRSSQELAHSTALRRNSTSAPTTSFHLPKTMSAASLQLNCVGRSLLSYGVAYCLSPCNMLQVIFHFHLSYEQAGAGIIISKCGAWGKSLLVHPFGTLQSSRQNCK